MLKILQARLQQYVNRELPDVQAGFRKGRGTRDQISNNDSFATLWTVACQASLSLGFPKQGYWSGLPFPPPGDLPDPGVEPKFLPPPDLPWWLRW